MTDAIDNRFYRELQQGTDDWKRARLGKVTASRISDLMAKTKTAGWGASRKNYMAELVVERLTGVPTEGYTNAAMQWGTDCEPQARAAYCFYTDAEVKQVGFIPHPRIAEAGCSPDGLVGEDGLVEIKCPTSATHIETLRDGFVPDKYIVQMQFQMACTDRDYCDFVSFDPRLPEGLSLFVQRVKRDDGAIGVMEKAVVEFLAELDETVAALLAKIEKVAA